jgi:peptidyl-prolyl cis-trans isomerase C
MDCVELDSCEPTPALKRELRFPISVLLTRWLREPLAHFLMIGMGLFVVYRALNPGASQTGSTCRIEVTVDDIRQLQLAFTAQWQRRPTAEEMADLVNNKFREEILYREALALGLDKDDTIVKRRMAQKMEFLAEDVSAVREPKVEELKAWFERNSGRFSLPSRATFRHLYFSFDRRRERARDDAVRSLAKLVAKPTGTRFAAAVADAFMLQDYYADRSQQQLAKEFGPNFATALFQLKPGSWQGPVESGYGWHLVWVYSIAPGRVPALEEVEPDVKAEWIAEQRAESRRKSFEAMKGRYELWLPQSSDERR